MQFNMHYQIKICGYKYNKTYMSLMVTKEKTSVDNQMIKRKESNQIITKELNKRKGGRGVKRTSKHT